jgi:hypothetical protein
MRLIKNSNKSPLQSDLCIYQKGSSLFIRNHHVQNPHEGPAFLQMNNTSYDKLIKAPVSGYSRLIKILRPGDVNV